MAMLDVSADSAAVPKCDNLMVFVFVSRVPKEKMDRDRS